MDIVIRNKLERMVFWWDMHACLVLLVGVVFVAVLGVGRWQQLNKGDGKVCFVNFSIPPSLSLCLLYF